MDTHAYAKGISLFNQRHFFDAHEVLEDVWRETHGPARSFLQGLIQIAVGLHHYGTGNREGARSLLRRGLTRLEPYPARYGGINVAALRQAVTAWHHALLKASPPPKLPRISLITRDAKIDFS